MLVDTEERATPVPRHALLVSDNPATTVPKKIVTGLDGSVDVKLRPGSYIVESDHPVAFGGKAYQWTQVVEIAAGRDAVLELNAENAEIAAVGADVASGGVAPENDPSFLLPRWQDSVVALWTRSTRASGFLVDARGLLLTNQRVVGNDPSVEVQLTPEVKVQARVLVAEATRDVAVLWIDPKAVASAGAVPLDCAPRTKPPVAAGQPVFALGAPPREHKSMRVASVGYVGPHVFLADFRLATGSAGGPVFSAAGSVVGIASLPDEHDEQAETRVVRIEDACEVLRAAEKDLGTAAPPDGAHLPVESARPASGQSLKEAVERRAGSLSAYRMSSGDFDVAFITPVLLYAAQHPPGKTSGGRGSGGGTEADERRIDPLANFANWSEYVADVPPVLLIRVTPRLVEGFWTTVARGAARTQGVALPPFKHFKPGFARMRAFCGDAEATPIHPFRLDQRISETDAIREGLYVFDPGALGPQCSAVKLMLYSEKTPDKPETLVVDPKIVQQIAADFAR
jgi:hypothetical protein